MSYNELQLVKSKLKKFKKPKKVSDPVKSYVKKRITASQEKKYFTQDAPAVSPIPYTGTFQMLSYDLLGTGMRQGAASNQRTGDTVNIKKLDVRLVLSTPSTYNSYARVLIVQYKNQKGLTLQLSDLMFNSAGAGPDRPLFPKHVLAERVKILYDKTHMVSATGNITADEHFKCVKIVKNLNIKQKFVRNSNLGTVADVENNGIWIVILGSHDSGSVARCTLRDFQWSCEYEDA